MSIIGKFGLPPQAQTTADKLDQLPVIFVLSVVVLSGGRQLVLDKAASTEKDKLEHLGQVLRHAKKCLDFRVSPVAYVPKNMSSETLSDYV